MFKEPQKAANSELRAWFFKIFCLRAAADATKAIIWPMDLFFNYLPLDIILASCILAQ
jgi:hypothetical protein